MRTRQPRRLDDGAAGVLAADVAPMGGLAIASQAAPLLVPVAVLEVAPVVLAVTGSGAAELVAPREARFSALNSHL